MASFGKVLTDSLKRLLFRELTVTRVVHLSEHFERIDFAGETLCGARYSPGDKVQIALDGGARTYTPFSFDGARGQMSILIYLHGDGPSSRWARGVKAGDRAYAFGPRSSLSLVSQPGPLSLFGDETSFGVGRAMLETGTAANDCLLVFEVTRADEAKPILDTLEMQNAVLIERRENDSHLADVEARLRAVPGRSAVARLVFTGKAHSIQALRERLKAAPIQHAGQLVKAYWSAGKRGLD